MKPGITFSEGQVLHEKKYFSPNPMSRLLLRSFLGRLSVLADKVEAQTILEVGCGPGVLLDGLFGSKSFGRMGFDIEWEAAKIAQQNNPQAAILQADYQ